MNMPRKTMPRTAASKRWKRGVKIALLVAAILGVVIFLASQNNRPQAEIPAQPSMTPTQVPTTTTVPPTATPQPTLTATPTVDPRAGHTRYILDWSVTPASPGKNHDFISAGHYVGLKDEEKIRYVCSINLVRGGVRTKYVFESESVDFNTTDGVSGGCYGIHLDDPGENHLLMVKYLNIAIAEIEKEGGLIYIDPDYEGYGREVQEKITTELP